MTEFGPFARWPDPRAYDLIAGYKWGDFQRSLLLGHQSWAWSGMTKYQQKAYDAVEECLTERGFRIARSPEFTADVVTITIDGIPAHDSNLAAMVDAWGIRFERIQVLALEGPVEFVGDHRVPIFRATTFGNIEGINGPTSRGIQRDVFIVGRRDVQQVNTYDGCGGRVVTVLDGDLRNERSRVRRTIRGARNTARKVDAAIPGWEALQATIARVDEARRLAEEAAAPEAEPVDEDLAAFRP